MGLDFKRFSDAGAFLEVAGPAMYAFEPQNNAILGFSEAMAGSATPAETLLVAGQEQGEVRVAAIKTQPFNLLLGSTGRMTDDDVVALAGWLRRESVSMDGVLSDPESALTFAREWTGSDPSTPSRELRILGLERVEFDGHDQGVMRAATVADEGWLFEWWRLFSADVGRPAADEAELRKTLGPRIQSGDVHLLELDRPVCMAARVRGTRTCDTIGGVYTPDAYRCQGHATALVARLSRLLLSRGKSQCALYTDKLNPTSNAIYERIGYREVMEAVEYVWKES